MTLGNVDKRHLLSRQPKQRASSDAGKMPSRVYLKSDKGQRLIACGSANIPTQLNKQREKEVIILNK